MAQVIYSASTGCIQREYSVYSVSVHSQNPFENAACELLWRGRTFKNTLETIIAKSEKQSMRVPPGVYANLGYFYLKANDENKAISYFELEKSTYPEAIHFMDRLINKVKTEL